MVENAPNRRNRATLEASDLPRLLGIASAGVAEASVVLLNRFRSPDLVVTSKGSSIDVVSDADRTAEAACRKLILGERPDDSFLGEEEGDRPGTSGVRWLLDPLDSTANFVRGIPIWSISLAAVDAIGTAVAVVACPQDGEVFSATRESPVHLNGRELPPRPVRSMAASMIAVGWGPRTGGRRQSLVAGLIVGKAGKVRSPGSPALGLAWTAAGRFDAAFYEMDFAAWDIAAGSLLCRQAGLIVHVAPPASPDASPRFLATTSHLETELLELLEGTQ